MTVREVREVVRWLEAKHARYDERETVEALRELAAILQPHDDQTVSAFVKRVKNGRQAKRSSANSERMHRVDRPGRPK